MSLSDFICSGVDRSDGEGLRSCLFLYCYVITEARRQVGSYIERKTMSVGSDGTSKMITLHSIYYIYLGFV